MLANTNGLPLEDLGSGFDLDLNFPKKNDLMIMIIIMQPDLSHVSFSFVAKCFSMLGNLFHTPHTKEMFQRN